MPAATNLSGRELAFRSGFKDLMPASPGTFAWGVVTGVAMIKSGLTLYQALGMTFIVFAGSAQLAALPLIAGAAPIWVIITTAVVVNLRFVIYSAAIRHQFYGKSKLWRLVSGYLTGDLGFVMFMQKIEREPDLKHRDWYFMGANGCNWVAWQVGSLIGIFAAAQVPAEWGLGLAGTLALIAVVIPMLSTRPVQVGVAVAALLAIVAHPLPLRLGLIVAVIGGIAASLLTERRQAGALQA